MSAETRVYLITGFLGSGKTTLLNRIIDRFPEDQKLTLLVNEFGEIGVDGTLVEGEDIDMMEISKGSIFCVCVKTDFIKGLYELNSKVKPDVLLIESTGVANPSDLKKDLKLPKTAGILVPKKGMSEVVKFLDSTGTVQVGIKNNNFIIKKDFETIIIRLLEGNFPEYGDIIKRGSSHAIHMDRKMFVSMLKRMSILSSEDYKGVIFNFTTDNLTVTTTNPDIGESKEEMPINFKGESIKVMFNPRYFIETLNVIDKDTVNLNIVDEEKPCLIQGEGDDTYLSVIMPMRI